MKDFDSIQAAADYAVQQMVAQGGQSQIAGSCAYHGENGRRCAIGWMLDDPGLDWVEAHNLQTACLGDVLPVLPLVVRREEETLELVQEFHDTLPFRSRAHIARILEDRSIDTSGEHWAAWVNMGQRCALTEDLEAAMRGRRNDLIVFALDMLALSAGVGMFWYWLTIR